MNGGVPSIADCCQLAPALVLLKSPKPAAAYSVVGVVGIATMLMRSNCAGRPLLMADQVTPSSVLFTNRSADPAYSVPVVLGSTASGAKRALLFISRHESPPFCVRKSVPLPMLTKSRPGSWGSIAKPLGGDWNRGNERTSCQLCPASVLLKMNRGVGGGSSICASIWLVCSCSTKENPRPTT